MAGKADLRSLQLVSAKTCIAQQLPAFLREAMNEFRAKFDGNRATDGMNSPTHAIAGLEYGNRQSAARENSCRRQTGYAGTDDDGVVAGCQAAEFSEGELSLGGPNAPPSECEPREHRAAAGLPLRPRAAGTWRAIPAIESAHRGDC
jgi:hypothetical protein